MAFAMRGIVEKIVFVVLLLNGYYVPFTRGLVCRTDQMSCDYNCYYPSTQNCLDDRIICGKDEKLTSNGTCVGVPSTKVYIPSTPGIQNSVEMICDPGQGACAGKCNSNKSHLCLVSQSTEVLCPNDQQACAGKCYSSKTLLCIVSPSSEALCSIGQEACGGTCFSGSEPKKCIRRADRAFLCMKDEEVCGTDGCYSPKTKVCFRNATLCEIGQSLCGSECYSNKGTKICLNNNNVCEAGQSLCGPRPHTESKFECYSPKTNICLDTGLLDQQQVCKVGEKFCEGYDGDDTGCYDPSAGAKCVGNEYSSGYYVCLKGKELCRGVCYDPASHVCVELNFTDFHGSYAIVCLKGEAACAGKCIKPSGKKCHSTGVHYDSQVLCLSTELVCGSECYKPESNKKICMPTSAPCSDPNLSAQRGECPEDGLSGLCNPEEKACERKCYNPKSHVCFQDHRKQIAM